MKIILSPAKKMKVDTDSIDTMSSPVFLEKKNEDFAAEVAAQMNA